MTRAAGAGPAVTAPKVVRRTPSGWWRRVAGAFTSHHLRRAVVLASIVAFLIVILGSSVKAWVTQRSEIEALRGEVAAQEADVEALRAELARWEDPAYVEQQARQRLKFVKPGERSYTVLDPEPESAGIPGVTGPGSAADGSALPWYGTVWESVQTADAPGARR